MNTLAAFLIFFHLFPPPLTFFQGQEAPDHAEASPGERPPPAGLGAYGARQEAVPPAAPERGFQKK